MARKEYSDIAVPSTLSGTLLIAGTSFTVAAATGWPTGTYQFVVKIEDELILCQSRSGTTITVASSGRGYAGTTAVQHLSGVAAEPIWDAASATDFARHLYDTTHNDHTQYLGSGAGTVGPTQLASNAVTTAKVADNAITAAKIGPDEVGSSELASDSVGTAEIQALAVTTAKLALLAVDATILAANAVTTAKILDANVTAAKIADGVITAAKLVSGTLPTAVATSAPTGVTGQLWYDSDDNLLYVYNGTSWVCITPQSAVVATFQTTTSTSFTDLGTSGPAVSIMTGTKALITVGARITQSVQGVYACMGFAVSGATTVAASDTSSVTYQAFGADEVQRVSNTIYVTGLTPGVNIFTAKYKRIGGSGNAGFTDRTISGVGIP